MLADHKCDAITISWANLVAHLNTQSSLITVLLTKHDWRLFSCSERFPNLVNIHSNRTGIPGTASNPWTCNCFTVLTFSKDHQGRQLPYHFSVSVLLLWEMPYHFLYFVVCIRHCSATFIYFCRTGLTSERDKSLDLIVCRHFFI